MDTESAPRIQAAMRPSPSQRSGSVPGRVLVVEDEPSLREVIEVLLSIEGGEVRAAADGAAAFEIMSTWKPDLILLDLHMPGMDGRAFLRAHRESDEPRCPVILLTGTSEPPDSFTELGAAAGTISKPFTVDELLEVVARFTDC